MHVARPEAGAEFCEERLNIRARIRPGRRCAFALMLGDSEIRPDQDVDGRMLYPICRQLFEIEERHLVNYGVAVTAGGGEEAVNGPEIVPATAAASPLGLSPEPVKMMFST